METISDLLYTRIDLSAIAHNTELMKARLGDARLMAVVKADGYGHGAAQVATTMAAHGADAFGVATLSEAVALRRSGIEQPILAWIWSTRQELSDAIAHGIELGVPSVEHARLLIDSGLPVTVSLKVDTGLHRSGVLEEEWPTLFSEMAQADSVKVSGLFSHFACADEPENPHNDTQAAAFERALRLGRAYGLALPINHLCNSPAALTRPEAHYQQARVGVALYGLEPVVGLDHGLRPAMTWAARITVLKPIAAGEAVSYGRTWTANKPGYLAVVPVGYADGLPRAWQGILQVGIGGKLYPQVGRVCMDQIVVDLGENEFGVQPNDEAIIFGTGGMSATELAEAAGTINYEVICRPTGRSARVYEGEGA